MSKIEELINKYCPDGVQYKSIAEIFDDFPGMTGVTNKWKEDGNCQFIDYMNAYKNEKIDVSKLPYATVRKIEQNTLQQGDILITSASEVPEECAYTSVIEGKIKDGIFLDDHLFGIRIKKEFKNLVNTTFANYFMKSKMFRKNVRKTVKGVTRFYVSPKDFVKLKIPVPPMEVQHEIVHILDDFTLLSAELSAELKARQKQYEYYSEKLLNENCEENYVRLGDITKTITKGTTPKKFVNKGINFIKTEAFDGMNINKNKLSFVDKETHNGFLKRSILEENDILFTIAGATIGKMVVITKELLPANTNQALAIIRLRDDINVNYIKFILKSSFMKKYIKKCIKGSAQPNLNLQQLNNFLVPFPNNEKQREIMNILDKFEKLVNDISEGLPAEIDARQKQYEYYRDKLLNFKELKAQ